MPPIGRRVVCGRCVNVLDASGWFVGGPGEYIGLRLNIYVGLAAAARTRSCESQTHHAYGNLT